MSKKEHDCGGLPKCIPSCPQWDPRAFWLSVLDAKIAYLRGRRQALAKLTADQVRSAVFAGMEMPGGGE